MRYYVPQITNHYKRVAQTPYSVIEPTSKNHLILLPKQATFADVDALKSDALRAEVQHDFKEAKRLWIRVLAASPADSDAIDGIERLSRRSDSAFSEPKSTSLREAADTMSSSVSDSRGLASLSKQNKQELILNQKHQHSATNSSEVASQSQARTPRPSSSSQPASKPDTEAAISPSLLGNISRRRAMQLLGFAGGGVGAIALGKIFVFPRSLEEKFEVANISSNGKDVIRRTSRTKLYAEELGDGTTLSLRTIAGGDYSMGSEIGGEENERPQHTVTVPSFLMSQYQVTQAQWKAVFALDKVERDLEADPSQFKGNNRPVEMVSWEGATEFCKRLSQHTRRSYRLPSEAEWEYACRAGTATPFHFGETVAPELANYDAAQAYGSGPKGESNNQTTNVGHFSVANRFGLYDMHGNVWEWCLDNWSEDYDDAPTDGSARELEGSPFKILRGGSWNDAPDQCRSAYRRSQRKTAEAYNTGFRIVCDSPWNV